MLECCMYSVYRVEQYKHLWQYELFVSYLDKVFLLLLVLLVLSQLIRGGSRGRAGVVGAATPPFIFIYTCKYTV